MKKDKVWKLTDEQRNLLKVRERTEIDKYRESCSILVAFNVIMLLILAIAVIGMILWFNKLTIFIASVVLLIILFVTFLVYVQYKATKTSTMKAKKRILEEN